jgi:hypothetical protein
MSDAQTNTGIFETRDDAGKPPSGEWKLWSEALQNADKTEEDWRTSAEETEKRFRDEEKRKGQQFNILYTNVETLKPAIYNSTPTPDVRRRFADADPVAKVGAQVVERCLSYSLDAYDFDCTMKGIVHDGVLVGRGVPVVDYEPTMERDETGQPTNITWQAVTCRQIDWKDFRMGPGRRWHEKPWIAERYRLTRELFDKAFPKLKDKDVRPDFVADGVEQKDERNVPDTFKRFTVWKIWDKDAREVHFWSPAYKDGLLKTEKDPLRLKDFYPVPRPFYDIEDPNNTIPLVPFNQYKDQADELDRLTKRINGLIAVLKWRGVRSADISEFGDIAKAVDGELVASQNLNQIIANGGIEKAIWLMPIDKVVVVLQQLYLARQEVKATIFEITGVADIMRGETDPGETLGAQQIKAQWGSLRLQHRQREIQRVARDVIRIKAEIIAEHFQPQTLAMMSGIELPTGEMKQQAQAAAQQMQAQQQPVPEQLQAILKQPSWDEVQKLLKSDALRGYRIDVETDSTIQADVVREQQQMGQFVQGTASYMQSVGPMVETGAMALKPAIDIYTAFARKFKLGKQAEDALDQLGQQAEQQSQQPPKPSPEEVKAQAEEKRIQMEAQAKERDLQMQGQFKEREFQMNEQAAQAQHQREMESMALKQQADQQANAFKMAEMQQQSTLAQESHGMERERLMMAADNDRAKARDSRNEIIAKRMGEKGEAVEGAEPEDLMAGFLKSMQAMVESNQQIAAAMMTFVQAQTAPKQMTVKKGANGTWTGESRVLQ